jgi:APA family basic amino acid/polyamine antiporter
MKESKTEHIITEEREIVTSTRQEKGTFFESVTARYTKIDPSSYLRKEGETSTKYWLRRLGHIKPVELLWSDSEHSELSRALNAFQLIFVGIGAIIGTGIFVLSGLAAAKNAGPAVTISFIIAAIAAGKKKKKKV